MKMMENKGIATYQLMLIRLPKNEINFLFPIQQLYSKSKLFYVFTKLFYVLHKIIYDMDDQIKQNFLEKKDLEIEKKLKITPALRPGQIIPLFNIHLFIISAVQRSASTVRSIHRYLAH